MPGIRDFFIGTPRSPQTVGVDIGSRFIKVAQVTIDRRGEKIVAMGKTATPKGALENGVVTLPAVVGRAIRQLCDFCGVTATQAVTCVGGPMVIVRKIELPAVNPRQLAQIIRLEAQKYIPYEVSRSFLEYQRLGPVAGDPGRMETMLVAAPRDLVEGCIRALEAAELTPRVVDIEPYAAVYAWRSGWLDSVPPERTQMLLELGASHTGITLVTGGQFALTRALMMGGDHLTQSLAEVLQVGFEEAEQFKQQECSAFALEPLDLVAAEDFPIQSTISNFFHHLVVEITRTIHSHQAQFAEEDERGTIERVWISGGGAQMRNIEGFLEQQLNVPVHRACLLTDRVAGGITALPVEIQNEVPLYSISLGLARREVLLERTR